MSEWLSALSTATAENMTVWAVAFVACVVVLQRIAAPKPKSPRVLVGLTLAHVVSVVLVSFGTGVIDLEAELNMLARLLAGWAFTLAVTLTLFHVLLPRLGVSLSPIIEDLAAFAAVIVVTMLVLRRGGVDVTGIVATSAVVTAVIGLSLQDTLGNTIGGLTLQLDNSIHTDDFIKVGDIVGRVKEVRWRFTAVETRNWETVYIPNSKLVKENVMVLGKRTDKPCVWRRWVYFNVDFRHAPTTVMEAAMSGLRDVDIEYVAKDPAPNCVLMDFGESTARYAVRYWLTNLHHDDPTDSAIRTRLYFALKRRGIPLALPAHALFLTEDTQKRRDRKQQEAHEQRRRGLDSATVFSPLDSDERDRIADLLVFAPYAKGERITRQGTEAHWLYLVGKGEVSVRVEGDGEEREVAKVSAGEVFGEMSLLTGAARAASVYALTDVECWRLDREVFKVIIEERPEIAGPLAKLLAERQVQLLAVKIGLDQEARGKALRDAEEKFLDKIRAYFAL